MHYFITQADDKALPVVHMISDSAHARLTLGAKRGQAALDNALRLVFGDLPAMFARITAAEYFDTLRAARDPGDGSDGGQR
ncbi:MAG: hypothetical protein ACTS5G_02470, partial [Burkholderiales bacterium]